MHLRGATLAFALAALALACAGTAAAHEPQTSNGVTVTLHVDPDDAPVAGQAATILIEDVRTRTGTFAWKTCACTLAVADATGAVVRKGPAGRATAIVFPQTGAYLVTFAGRVKRSGAWKAFKVTWALRAEAAQ